MTENSNAFATQTIISIFGIPITRRTIVLTLITSTIAAIYIYSNTDDLNIVFWSTLLLGVFFGILFSGPSANWYITRGIDKYHAGKYKEAVCEFSKALKIYSKQTVGKTVQDGFRNSYYNRASSYVALGDYQSALLDSDKLIEAHPYDFSYYSLRSNIKTYLHDFKGALVDLDKAIEINATNNYEKINATDSDLYTLRGDVKSRTGDYQKAINDYKKAIELNPGNHALLFSLASVKHWSGDNNGAISDLTKLIDYTPSLDAYFMRGIARHNLEDFQGAIVDFSMAIDVAPKYADPFCARGNAKKQLGDLKGACEDWKKAAELGDEDAAVLVEEHCE